MIFMAIFVFFIIYGAAVFSYNFVHSYYYTDQNEKINKNMVIISIFCFYIKYWRVKIRKKLYNF